MSGPERKISTSHKRYSKNKNKDKNKARLSLVFPHDWTHCDPHDFSNPSLYINRELSWLEFNQRVLDQASDARHPLLERIKFLSIVATNLDEFFMIRIATILKKYRANVEDMTPDGLNTEQQLWATRERVQKMLLDQWACWNTQLRPGLNQEGIFFIEPQEWAPALNEYLTDYFNRLIHPVLTPLAFDTGHPFPHISNLSMNFAIAVRHNQETKFARVKIPNMLPRFIPVPEKIAGRAGTHYVYLEDVIRANMPSLFPGTQLEGVHLFRIIRDTDIIIQEDEADDLLESVDKSLKQLKYGALSQLMVEPTMPQRVVDILAENFEVEEDIIIRTEQRMGIGDWMSLAKIHRPQLKYPPFSPGQLFSSDEPQSVFDQIKYQDYLVHHPYESFNSIELFLKAAVNDSNVVAIKMTLYRIGENSPIIEQLIRAAEAGKQVAVLVELKARFDERNNIVWANRLESVGVHVVYGLMKLKTHGKLCLVVRNESDGIRRYVHVGTGNYNRQTSQVYTDLGLFTADPQIAEDVSEVFNYLTGYSNKKTYNQLLVAPVSLRQGLLDLIRREIEHAKAGKEARIIIKNNAVADLPIIQELYRASQAGVKVDMIVRSLCCLRPGIPGISDNIRVISVVGRFLEHSRIYYFHNEGHEEVYIGSADLMERNLDRRVEILCPIRNPLIRNHVKNTILETLLQDNQQAMVLKTDGTYARPYMSMHTAEEPINAQNFLLNWYTNKNR